MAHALSQYCNTPLPRICLSPAQTLFHLQRRDAVPSPLQHYKHQRNWKFQRNHAITEKYEKKTHQLDEFEIRLDMAIQDRGRTSHKHWYKTGRILEVLPHKQNQVKLNGQVE